MPLTHLYNWFMFFQTHKYQIIHNFNTNSWQDSCQSQSQRIITNFLAYLPLLLVYESCTFPFLLHVETDVQVTLFLSVESRRFTLIARFAIPHFSLSLGYRRCRRRIRTLSLLAEANYLGSPRRGGSLWPRALLFKESVDISTVFTLPRKVGQFLRTYQRCSTSA